MLATVHLNEHLLSTPVLAGDGWPLREHCGFTQLQDQLISKLQLAFFSLLPLQREIK